MSSPLLALPRSVQLTAGTLLHVYTATQSAPSARLAQSVPPGPLSKDEAQASLS